MPSRRKTRRTRKNHRRTRKRVTGGMDAEYDDFDVAEFDQFDLGRLERTPKKPRRSRKRSTCTTANCRRHIGHPGKHSALAERLLAMSPAARKEYYQQVNSPRRRERDRASRSVSCNTPHCQKPRNHPPPCTQKAKFVRCPERHCHKAVNHDGKHSDPPGKPASPWRPPLGSVMGRSVGVGTDLAITGNKR